MGRLKNSHNFMLFGLLKDIYMIYKLFFVGAMVGRISPRV